MNRRLSSGTVSAASLLVIAQAVATRWLPQQRAVAHSSLDCRPGDPGDPARQNLRYALAVAGIIEEFGTLKAGLAALGMTTLPEFYAAVGDPNFPRLAENDDGVLCYKPVYEAPPFPAQKTTSPPTPSERPVPTIELDTFDALGY